MVANPLLHKLWEMMRLCGGEILRISDEVYTTVRFKKVFHRDIDLLHPRTYNEKVQFLKLFNRDPLLTILADKYEVRRYVAERGFAHTLNELYGVYERTAAINLESLPDQFVMKATHGSGWNILCQQKSSFDWNAARRQLDQWLKTNYYSYGKEWAYKNIRPRIVVERYLGYQIHDYKVSCFNGVPRFIGVDMDRFTHHKRNIYDTDWNFLPIHMNYDHFDPGRVPRPGRLSELLEVAAGLARGLPFVRVDLYEVEGRVYFGEMTLYPAAGLQRFTPPAIDDAWGALFDVSTYQPAAYQKLLIQLAGGIGRLVR